MCSSLNLIVIDSTEINQQENIYGILKALPCVSADKGTVLIISILTIHSEESIAKNLGSKIGSGSSQNYTRLVL